MAWDEEKATMREEIEDLQREANMWMAKSQAAERALDFAIASGIVLSVQTRNEEGELCYFERFDHALEFARQHEEVWKLSFSLPTGERVRLVRVGLFHPDIPQGFVLEQMEDELRGILGRERHE